MGDFGSSREGKEKEKREDVVEGKGRKGETEGVIERQKKKIKEGREEKKSKKKKKRQSCKPGSVPPGPLQGRRAMTISLGRRLPDASSSRPGRNGETGRFTSAETGRSRHDRTSSCLALLPMGFTEPDRSPGPLVSSYLTVSPLPAGRPAGGLFSVALSLASRPVGVTHHRTLRSPDFPPARAAPPPGGSERPRAGDHPVRSSSSKASYACIERRGDPPPKLAAVVRFPDS